MNAKQLFFISACVFALGVGGAAVAQEMQGQYVQIAEIEIDPAHLEDYKAAVREHIEAAIRVEPGVLVLYSVFEKDNPTHIRVFEIYASTTGRTWRPRISKNTRQLRRRWSSRLSLSKPLPSCSAPSRDEGQARRVGWAAFGPISQRRGFEMLQKQAEAMKEIMHRTRLRRPFSGFAARERAS